MKKKVKLFVTLAALCLSIAMLTFGVYAATSVTYTISGKVTYTVLDVFATVTVTAEPMKNAEKSGYADATATKTAGAAGTATYDDTKAITWTQATFNGQLAADATSYTNVGTTEFELDFNESTLWRVTITITSNQDAAMYVSNISSTSTDFENANWSKDTQEGSTVTIDAKASGSLVYYASLQSAIKAASGNWSVSFTLANTNS